MAPISLLESASRGRNPMTAWPWRPVRHVVQLLFTALLFALPLLSLFRIDVRGRYMLVFGQTIWMQEFYFLALGTLIFVFFFTAVTLTLGRVWCGWLCPQTPLAELSNWVLGLIRRSRGVLRGLLVVISLLALLAVALAVSFAAMSYVIAPQDLLADAATGAWTVWIWGLMAATALAVLVDVIFLRHTFCRVACPYGLIQSFLTDKDTLRIRFMTERATDCINCFECSKVCPVELEPRKHKFQLECITCAECIVACEEVLKPLGRPGLIEFSFGQRSRSQQREGAISGKALAVSAVFLVYTGVFIYLLANRSPLAVQVVPDPAQRSALRGDVVSAGYLVEISNRGREPAAYKVQVQGLPEGAVEVTPNTVALPAGQQSRAVVRIAVPRGQLSAGTHPFTVTVNSLTQAGLSRQEDSSFFVPP